MIKTLANNWKAEGEISHRLTKYWKKNKASTLTKQENATANSRSVWHLQKPVIENRKWTNIIRCCDVIENQ